MVRIVALLAFMALSTAAHATTADLVGRASVIDGDTLELHSERIRLSGIDAPESAQMCLDADGAAYRCGRSAALALDEFLSRSRPTKCTPVERDRYGRIVAECWRADGESVSDWMVRSGWAVDYTQYSGGAYAAHQSVAESEKIGIWSGAFIMPAQWRRGERLAQQGEPDADADCPIKGNISSKGERIYHSPGQMHYDRTKIDTSKGERWFCTSDEAEEAGWRPAQR